jgi:hypothetical protein
MQAVLLNSSTYFLLHNIRLTAGNGALEKNMKFGQKNEILV